MLELAILGLLLESPMHGYELRKTADRPARRVPRVLLRFAVPGPAPDASRRDDRRERRARGDAGAAPRPPGLPADR